MRHRPPRPSAQQLKLVQQHVRQTLLDAALASVARSDDGTPMTVARAAEPRGPSRLAQAHLEGPARAEAEALYAGCLRHYRSAIRPHDEADDAGAAVAHFVAANLFAIGAEPATPTMLERLQRQLLPVARAASNWMSTSTVERQMFFEQVALLSVLIGGMAQHANAHGAAAQAKVRDAARQYLQKFLGLNPDTLALNAQGLTLREPARRAA